MLVAHQKKKKQYIFEGACWYYEAKVNRMTGKDTAILPFKTLG